MAAGDIYKLVTVYDFLGEIAQNRYYYLTAVFDGGNAASVGNSWVANVFPELQNIMSDQCSLVRWECINLMDDTDFFEKPEGLAGVRGGEAMPPFVSWGFRLNRTSREFRPGAKRITGVAEQDVVNGVPTLTIEPDLDLAAAKLGDAISRITGGNDLWEPALVRELVGLPPSEFTLVTGAEFIRVTTQNSRKFNS